MSVPSDNAERAVGGLIGAFLAAVGIGGIILLVWASDLNAYVAACNSVMGLYGRQNDASLDAKCMGAEFVLQWRVILFLFAGGVLIAGVVRLLATIPAVRDWMRQQDD